MMGVTLPLLILVAACAPASDNAGNSTAADSTPAAAPTAETPRTPDTLNTMTRSGEPASPAARSPSAAPSQAAREQVRGTVRLTGTALEPITVIESLRGTLVVRGELEREVRSLAGAIVMLTGKVTTEPRPVIDVDAYSVLEIEGQPATVGIVTDDARGIIVDGDTVALVPPPPGLKPGSRIWVSGPRTGSTLRVSSFGVIRPAQ